MLLALMTAHSIHTSNMQRRAQLTAKARDRNEKQPSHKTVVTPGLGERQGEMNDHA